jgi:hypothetical protein
MKTLYDQLSKGAREAVALLVGADPEDSTFHIYLTDIPALHEGFNVGEATRAYLQARLSEIDRAEIKRTGTNQKAGPIVSDQGNHMHYYRPLDHYDGAVLKYQGEASENNLAYFPRHWMDSHDDGYMPGVLILPQYMGDRIRAADYSQFTD